ncbi:MAG: DUF664 domain-containing protein [Acidimicrobiales bacterium]
MPEFPNPSLRCASRSDVIIAYLDYFREGVIDRVESISDEEIRSSRLASGWTPIELLRHLTFVELRWLEWGFEGQNVEDPWGDRRDDRWYVSEDESCESVIEELRSRGRCSAAIIRESGLDALGQPGPRWKDPNDPPSLDRILLHLLQEYARHLGHLDIVVEIAGGSTGE